MELLFRVPSSQQFPLYFLLPLFSPPSKNIYLFAHIQGQVVGAVGGGRRSWGRGLPHSLETIASGIGEDFPPSDLQVPVGPLLLLPGVPFPCSSRNQRASPGSPSAFMPTSRFPQSRWQDTRGNKVKSPLVP